MSTHSLYKSFWFCVKCCCCSSIYMRKHSFSFPMTSALFFPPFSCFSFQYDGPHSNLKYKAFLCFVSDEEYNTNEMISLQVFQINGLGKCWSDRSILGIQIKNKGKSDELLELPRTSKTISFFTPLMFTHFHWDEEMPLIHWLVNWTKQLYSWIDIQEKFSNWEISGHVHFNIKHGWKSMQKDLTWTNLIMFFQLFDQSRDVNKVITVNFRGRGLGFA